MEDIRKFEWESDEQRKGYLALVQAWQKHGQSAPFPITARENLTALFFIQKDHESHQYWLELVGKQVAMLQDEILSVRNSLAGALTDIESLTHRIAELEAENRKNRG